MINGQHRLVPKYFCCSGYTRWNKKCLPKCDQQCLNSQCTKPNECTCLKGYKPLSQFKCEPECTNCTSGYCTAPEKCSCYRGFKNNEDKSSCLPICDPECLNGECIEPDLCRCFDGL